MIFSICKLAHLWSPTCSHGHRTKHWTQCKNLRQWQGQWKSNQFDELSTQHQLLERPLSPVKPTDFQSPQTCPLTRPWPITTHFRFSIAQLQLKLIDQALHILPALRSRPQTSPCPVSVLTWDNLRRQSIPSLRCSWKISRIRQT